ncbi:hypothetical protein BFF78_23460 [Streptomyces fodineus]|uniref:Chaplin domain-containing protein n=1 Tax=Streptomyces fodineus TaxID=1904616 RepID=A0A1D7YDS2_9ACTN|nr:hypothetical protein [Streptomyces fodineus]AOR33630.1 hypothetical protein BFF78_23460 [Streptomyces fodineus]
MMKKLLVTAVLTASAAALAAPAHADDRGYDADAARCVENLAVLPALTPVSPLALAAGALAAAPTCGAQSALERINGNG